MSGSQEEQAKLVTYNVLASGEEQQSKLVTYNAITQESLNQQKLVTYLVLLPLASISFGPIPIFPSLPAGYPVKVGIIMDTVIGTTKSLREMRVAQQTYPLWDIEIPFYELLDQTQNQTPYVPFIGDHDYEQLCQLWLQMYGQTNVFGFNCPWDNSRTNQQIGTGDGATITFTVYRTWGVGSTATVAPVGLINTVSQVQVNGVTISPSNYTIGRDSITFATAPGAGLPVTMTFSYYYLCRFVEDEQDFEEFAKNRWTVPSLKFQAVLWV